MYSRSTHYSPSQTTTKSQVLAPWPLRTPPLSYTDLTVSTASSPVEYLENLVEAELDTWSSPSTSRRSPSTHLIGMESSWRDDASSSSYGQQHTYGHGHGYGIHRRGPSELEHTASVIWDTSQSNGELGLAPDQTHGQSTKYPGMVIPPIAVAGHSQGHVRGSGGLPLPIAVWAKVMDTSKGRDKVLVSPTPRIRSVLKVTRSTSHHDEVTMTRCSW